MSEIVFLPHSLALVEQLSPHDSSSHALRAQAIEVLQHNPSLLTCIHYAQRTSDYTAHTGSFRAWGAPQVTVGAGNYSPELLARYLLAAAGQTADVQVQTYTAPEAFHLQSGMRHLVVLDGVAGLTTKAPKYLRPTAAATHEWCVQVLHQQAPQQCYNEEQLSAAGVDNPTLWPAIYELSRTGSWQTTSYYAATEHGVARFVATWQLNDAQ